ncbi:MAG: phenylalanine--tRNA ligase subunit alpha [Pseudomonadota bacterium]
MATATTTQDLEQLEAKLLGEVLAAADPQALDQVRVSALGKKGQVSALMAQLGRMPPDERKAFGQAVNQVKSRVSDALQARKSELDQAALDQRLATERMDMTLPVRPGPQLDGRIHPLSHVIDEVAEIFADLGFKIAEGPDIETDELNFTKLNVPPEHPARQDQDTFYFKPKADGSQMLLRTQTSPVQIRTMMSQKPPIRIIAPGRVYRMDYDQTHTPMFHQIEGLVIDEHAHMGHLKWTLEAFCKAFFEVDDVRMRFRASYFPFTEPSAEVDIGAEALGRPGEWMEILGCGMVHPRVIEGCGLDPNTYQGFAWGMGLDRITMLKYGISDLRQLFAADLRWLKHYGFLPFEVPTLAGGLSA